MRSTVKEVISLPLFSISLFAISIAWSSVIASSAEVTAQSIRNHAVMLSNTVNANGVKNLFICQPVSCSVLIDGEQVGPTAATFPPPAPGVVSPTYPTPAKTGASPRGCALYPWRAHSDRAGSIPSGDRLVSGLSPPTLFELGRRGRLATARSFSPSHPGRAETRPLPVASAFFAFILSISSL